jgi:hypothetical protein
MKPYLLIIIILCSVIPGLSAAAETTAPPGLTLNLELGKEKAYPGETVPVTVILHIKGVSIRNIGYPRLTQPGGGLISFLPPTQSIDKDDTGITAYRFPGQFTVGNQGTGKIGPATLDCEAIEQATGSAAFFGESVPRTVSVSSPVALLQILPLPEAGRPSTFSGAVGNFSIEVTAKPETVSVGDPLTITTVITGTGTFRNATCPSITGTGLQSFPVRVTRSDKQLSCEQVIVPKAQLPLPPVTWSYFDPGKRIYKTLSYTLTTAFKTEQHENKTNTTKPTSSVPEQSSYRNNLLTPLTIILIVIISLFLVIAGWVLVYRKRVAHPPARPVVTVQQRINEADKVLKTGDVEKFYTVIFSILQLIVASQNNQLAHSVSDITETHTRENPIDARLSTLFQRCHEVRYGQRLADSNEMHNDLNLLKCVSSNLEHL